LTGSEYQKQIKAISSLMKSDGLSPDETDSAKLSKYHDFAKSEFNASDESAAQLVFESLVYLKLQSTDMDPLSEGEKFGVGLS